MKVENEKQNSNSLKRLSNYSECSVQNELNLEKRISLCLCAFVVKNGSVQWLSNHSEMLENTNMSLINENLNRQLKAGLEMLLDFERRCAQALSKISEMLDNLRWVPAQTVSRMSKMIPQARDILLRRVLTSHRKRGQSITA